MHLRDFALKNTQLKDLADQVAEMGGLVEKNFADTVLSIARMDKELASRVVTSDAQINVLEGAILELSVKALRRHAGSNAALAEILAITRIAASLEQIGDLIKSIARRIASLETRSKAPDDMFMGLQNLCEITMGQLSSALDAFVSRDVSRIKSIADHDDAIDSLYGSLFKSLLQHMQRDPQSVEVCTQLLFCAKNLERIGDHATDIAKSLRSFSPSSAAPIAS